MNLLAFLLLPLLARSSPLLGSIEWRNCSAESVPRLSCGELKVPVDWDEPHGEHISIFMARYAAKDASNKIGSLLFNPGGPGDPATAYVEGFSEYGASPFPDHFDVIGPDIRGVGRSHPMKCDPALWNQVVSYQPNEEVGFQELVTHNEELGKSCREMTGPLLEHLDSASIAKDFDAIRSALGETKITYLGLSYGTVIGQAYAELFPDNIRAMALDGNIDHSLGETAALAVQAYAYEDEFLRFSAWCRATPSCPLHEQDVGQLLMNLTAQAGKSPIPAPACQKSGACKANVSSFDITSTLESLLYFKHSNYILSTSWNDAANALKQAASGNATLLSPQAATSPNSTVMYMSGIGTVCLDWNHTAIDLADLVYNKHMARAISPYTQGGVPQFLFQSACIGWPAPVQYIPHTVNITGTPPILLTNSYHDPASSYVEANGVLHQFENAVLATRRGDGHTSYFLLGETWQAINEYLVTLQTPEPNTVFNS